MKKCIFLFYDLIYCMNNTTNVPLIKSSPDKKQNKNNSPCPTARAKLYEISKLI